MSRGPEGRLTAKVRAYLLAERRAGRLWFFKVHGSVFQEAGVPDLVLCVDGVFLAIELKAPGERPTPLQRVQLDAIAAAGGVAVVASSLEDVIAIIDTTRARSLRSSA